jgi:hypothetical protein
MSSYGPVDPDKQILLEPQLNIKGEVSCLVNPIDSQTTVFKIISQKIP